jgi:hypothetical protein
MDSKGFSSLIRRGSSIIALVIILSGKSGVRIKARKKAEALSAASAYSDF